MTQKQEVNKGMLTLGILLVIASFLMGLFGYSWDILSNQRNFPMAAFYALILPIVFIVGTGIAMSAYPQKHSD